jgi:hypothetical protein
MQITTKPYSIDKLTFFRRVVPTRNRKLDTFEVFPQEQHRLNITETILTLPEGNAHSVGFVLDGVAYHLESKAQFIPTSKE